MKTIMILPDGTVRFLYDDDTSDILSELGPGRKIRASHVEPTSRVLRWLFHAIRSRVADDSWLAGFTRRWPCEWRASIIGGPTLGPFRQRADAIAAEIEYIESRPWQ